MILIYWSIFPCGIQRLSLDVPIVSLVWVLVFICIPGLIMLLSTVLKVSHVVLHCSQVSHAVLRNKILSHGNSVPHPWYIHPSSFSHVWLQVGMKDLNSSLYIWQSPFALLFCKSLLNCWCFSQCYCLLFLKSD